MLALNPPQTGTDHRPASLLPGVSSHSALPACPPGQLAALRWHVVNLEAKKPVFHLMKHLEKSVHFESRNRAFWMLFTPPGLGPRRELDEHWPVDWLEK